MDRKSLMLGIMVLFAVGFSLFGAIAYSDKDPVQKNQTKMEGIKSGPGQAGHDHRDLDHDEGKDHQGHRAHSQEHDDHENGHEEDVHRGESHRHLHHADETDREHSDHEKASNEGDEEHDHDEEDHEDDALKLTGAQQREINLTLERAGPGSLHSELSLMGEVGLNQDRVAHVVPRVSGVVREVRVSLGDQVKAGQILASLESAELAGTKADYLEKLKQYDIAKKAYHRKKYLREEKIASEASWLEKEAEYLIAETTLKSARSRLVLYGLTEEEIQALPHASHSHFGRYAQRAPISGTVIEKHITMGEKLNDESEIFTISDLSRIWVDLKVPARDIYRVKKGSEVIIQSSNGIKTTGTITLIGPVVEKVTRTALARVVIDNKDSRWKPGTFVTGYVHISMADLPVVVPAEAVQNVEGQDVVFVQQGDSFKLFPVVIGRRDRNRVEIVSGLKPGTTYVTRGAFELKAMMITSSLGSHAGHGH
ncbi:MAG: efflux RND transporter periplasmic adaptor subunit [Thermodesulfobacteriota bacterium]|nr:efflux RND transporter periplasmic adaptor subunit [Thermodesulfobacteriota bacterium]